MSGFFGKGIRCAQLGKLLITPSVSRKSEGSIIILHGSCDTGSGMKAWIDKIRRTEFNFDNYRVLYPSAPSRPYTLLNGENTGIWFDRLSLEPTTPEDLLSIESTANALSELMQQESKNTGIPLNRMIVGGFAMGGIMALHMAYRFQTQLAGVFALSSCLPIDSEIYNSLKSKTETPATFMPNNATKAKLISESSVPNQQSLITRPKPNTKLKTPTLDKILRDAKLNEGVKPQFPVLFMSQGSRDPLVLYPWAKHTFTELRGYGVQGHFFTHPTGEHNIERTQLTLLHRWIQDILKNNPDSPTTKFRKGKPTHISNKSVEPVG